MYINTVEILKDHRNLHKGDIFTISDITALVGDQGCGKSTLLSGLQNKEDFLKIDLTTTGDKGVKGYYFDSEKMNPRITNPMSYTNVDGTSRGIGLAGALAGRWQSHGEVLEGFTVSALKRANDCVILLDEPESGLSLRNQYKLWHEIQEAAKRKCQIILATHCLVIIQELGSVLSLEHRMWMANDKFIESNKL